MNRLAIVEVSTVLDESIGERLYREFLAGRSPHTHAAYAKDLAAFAAFSTSSGPGAALATLIAMSAGEGNSHGITNATSSLSTLPTS
jgi:hypothetical protein